MLEVTGIDQQRVAGWLALTLQTPPTGPLLAARRVQYSTGETGQVVVAWRGGPTATAVAEHLAAAADPDMPVADREVPLPRTPESVRLQVGAVPVLLHAYEPNPREQPVPVTRSEPWTWPNPLAADGACEHAVLWHLPADDGGGIATVVEIPCDPQVHGVAQWSERAHQVVHAEAAASEYDLGDGRRRRWQRRRDHARVLLRMAGPGVSITEADEWMRRQQQDAGALSPPPMVAVCFPPDLVLLRVVSSRVGWRIVARPDRVTPGNVVPLLPAAVFDAICLNPTLRPPERLSVRRFGNEWSSQAWQLETEPIAPA